jgi:ADP-ribose pyrophosphatase
MGRGRSPSLYVVSALPTPARLPGYILRRMEDGSWQTLERSYLYRNPWCAFRVDEVVLPDGVTIEYGVLEGGGFASVVPVTDYAKVVLVRQWRQPLSSFTLELPSGRVDKGEYPQIAAERELFEETGFRAGELEHLVSVHTSTGRTDEVCHLFRCRAVQDPGGPRPEPTEFIRVVELPFEEALKRISDGAITDAATVLGLLWSGRLFPNET